MSALDWNTILDFSDLDAFRASASARCPPHKQIIFFIIINDIKIYCCAENSKQHDSVSCSQVNYILIHQIFN